MTNDIRQHLATKGNTLTGWLMNRLEGKPEYQSIYNELNNEEFWVDLIGNEFAFEGGEVSDKAYDTIINIMQDNDVPYIFERLPL